MKEKEQMILIHIILLQNIIHTGLCIEVLAFFLKLFWIHTHNVINQRLLSIIVEVTTFKDTFENIIKALRLEKYYMKIVSLIDIQSEFRLRYSMMTRLN